MKHTAGRALLCLFLFMMAAGPALSQNRSACPQPTGDTPAPLVYRTLGDDFAAAISARMLDYLNTSGTAAGLLDWLQPDAAGIDAEVLTADVTGDGAEDLLVNVSLTPGPYFTGVIALYGCASQRYVLLGQVETGDFFDSAYTPPVSIVSLRDMNHDGRTEIVTRQGMVTQKYQEAVRIYEWNGEMLAPVFDSGYSLGAYDDIRVEEADSDPTTLELIVDDRWAYGQGVATAVIELTRWRPIEVVYAWDGTGYTAICRHFTDDPTTLFETLHSAETYRACGNLDQAQRFYQRMVVDPTLQTWAMAEGFGPADPDSYNNRVERAYLAAFAHYRIAQILLERNDVEMAQEVVRQALNAYPPGQFGHQYAVMSGALWEDFGKSGDLTHACAAAETALESVRHDGSDPGIDPVAASMDPSIHWGFYYESGFNYSPDPDDLFTVPEAIQSMVSIPICLA